MGFEAVGHAGAGWFVVVVSNDVEERLKGFATRRRPKRVLRPMVE